MQKEINSDEVLLQKYQSLGDIRSLDTLIGRYLNKVYLYFRKQVSVQEDVEDLVQNVFLKVTRKINTGETIKSFQDYLFISCQNSFRDFLRKKSKTPPIDRLNNTNTVIEYDFMIFSDWINNEIRPVLSLKQLEEIITQCVEDISSEKARQVVADYVAGYTLKEIARRNNCPTATAGSIWFRHKKKYSFVF